MTHLFYFIPVILLFIFYLSTNLRSSIYFEKKKKPSVSIIPSLKTFKEFDC